VFCFDFYFVRGIEMNKLSNKELAKLSAVVIFKCIEKELNQLRERGNVTCPASDSQIVEAIADNLNVRTKQWRKTPPPTKFGEVLHYALRFRTGKVATVSGLMMQAMRHGQEVTDGFDTIACLMIRNKESIRTMASKTLSKGN
jgi:hypothetical protein